MKCRLVILTEIIAPYRIPVFNALARHRDVKLHVVFLTETDPSLRQWLVYKDEIEFSYEVLPAWRRRVGKYNVLLNWKLRAALQAASPDSILIGGYNYLSSWEALLWARRRGVAALLWVESTGPDRRHCYTAVEFLKKYFCTHCNGFVVPGKASLEYLRTMGVSENVIFIAPNAVDNRFFSNTALAVRSSELEFRCRLGLPSRFFLYAGRLVPEKGVFDLLEAYARLNSELRSAIGLVFAGDGKSRPELQKRASNISPGTIHFAGFAQREMLAQFYALAEALVFPTHSDPWGFVVNEAMCCGLPVIASNIAGCAPDLVENGWNGFTLPSGDVTQLSEVMDLLARRPDLRSQMSLRSSERILNYSPESWAAGLRQALDGGRRVLHHG